jgi:GNAT superfamily N-acetyltransferase
MRMESENMNTLTASQLALPDGLTAHPARMQDIPAVTGLFNATSRRILGVEKFRIIDTASEWELPDFNPETHTLVVWDSAHNPLGYIEFWDLVQPRVVMNCWMRIHPEYEHTSIGAFLLDWAERQVRQRLPTVPEELRVVLRAGVPVLLPAMQDDFRQAGFQPVRRFWTMVIDLDQTPVEPQFPDGILVRSMQAGEERLAIRALADAFHDHWGHVDTPFEEEFARWQHFLRNDPDFDPNLWFFAMDDGQIAGFSYCREHANSDPEMGWVGQLGVLRPWRKQGLGLALLQHSFGEFYRRDKKRAGLGVDASSLTGATRLYEKGGMRPDEKRTMDAYEKELRPGTDISTQTVEE